MFAKVRKNSLFVVSVRKFYFTKHRTASQAMATTYATVKTYAKISVGSMSRGLGVDAKGVQANRAGPKSHSR